MRSRARSSSTTALSARSWRSLASIGNLSSASVLFVVADLLEFGRGREGRLRRAPLSRAGVLRRNGADKMVSDSFDVVVCGGGPAWIGGRHHGRRSKSVCARPRETRLPAGQGLRRRAAAPGGASSGASRSSRGHGPTDCRRFRGIRFIQEDGSSVEALLPGGGGLGVRRTVLVDALSRRARDAGVIVRHGCAVRSVERTSDVARVHTESGAVSTRVVVAADGLHSPLPNGCGSGAPTQPATPLRASPALPHQTVERFRRGPRRCDGRGRRDARLRRERQRQLRVGEKGELDQPTLETLASRFPLLGARLRNAPALSSVRGAGPMACGATRRSANRLVLIGDAAGFIDSISADGLSIAFNSALLFGHELPEAVARGATEPSFAGYERGQQRLFRTYWALTNGRCGSRDIPASADR